MQTRKQWEPTRNWKVVAGVTTAAALGAATLAMASGDSGPNPDPIDLRERGVVTEFKDSSFIGDNIFSSEDIGGGNDLSETFDSPFDSPASPDSPDSVGSPGSADSPDSPSTAQPDSPDSPDAPDSPDSPDGSSFS